jgi:hypothetical protein
MTSFIEIPQMGWGGVELPSLYVNVADIITVASSCNHGTEFRVRELGDEGVARFKSYLPIGMFLDLLGELARFPGVRSWSDDTKRAHRESAQERARAAEQARKSIA